MLYSYEVVNRFYKMGLFTKEDYDKMFPEG